MSVVLVTGASTGFGRLTVEELARRGHRVYAGVRAITGRNAQAAAELREQQITVVELDVLDQASADAAVAAIVEAEGRLDAVVNNAGRSFIGPIEAFTADEIRTAFDVNVLGPARVARAALPAMRSQGEGVLIQNGSMAGWVSVPYAGLYAASKSAMRSLVETWHHELAPFGIESVTVDAAAYPTNIAANTGWPTDDERAAAYGGGLGGFMSDLTAHAEGGEPGDPRDVAEAFVRLVEMPAGTRPRRTFVAPPAEREAVEASAALADRSTHVVAADMGIDGHLRRG